MLSPKAWHSRAISGRRNSLKSPANINKELPLWIDQHVLRAVTGLPRSRCGHLPMWGHLCEDHGSPAAWPTSKNTFLVVPQASAMLRGVSMRVEGLISTSAYHNQETAKPDNTVPAAPLES